MHVSAVLVAALCVAAVHASEDVVHIKSKYSAPPLITSSTLRWVKKSMGERSEAAVVGGLEIVPGDNTNGEDEENLDVVQQRDVYVCRARHNGEWLAGMLRSGHPACHVALGNHVFRYNEYESLDNEDKGARLSWVRWDRFSSEMPDGAVAAGDNYIARRKVEIPADGRAVLGFTHLLGQIEKRGFQGSLNVVDQNDKAAEFQDGEVLVENEPIRYELTITSFNHRRQKVKRQARVLGTTTLRNGGAAYAVNVDTALAYDANYSLYYSQGRAILKGLPTLIRVPDGKPNEEIKWGIAVVEERKDVHRVEAHLAPGTAVNVTLVGNHTDTETPYTGKLTAVYEDGESTTRTIGGSRREVAMLDVHAELGPVYFLSNDSLVPTTTTTTTTTTSTTTTTTTTTTTSTTTEEPSSTPDLSKKPKKTLPGESEGPAHKGENSSMQSDEGENATPQREAVISESGASAAAATLLALALPCVLLRIA